MHKIVKQVSNSVRSLSVVRSINLSVSSRRFSSSKTAEDKKDPEELYASVEDDYEVTALEREQLLEEKRNKSKLSVQHQNIVNGRVPYEEPMDDAHLTLKYKRRMFGRYGYQSKLDPGTLWPNMDDINKTVNYEKIAYPYSIQESIVRQKEKINEENRLIEERQEKILNNLKKLSQWKKEIEDRAAKKRADLEKAQMKRDALVEEVRKHFGYKLDEKDEKFKEMLLQKERAQKKKLKEERSKVKQEQLLNQMINKDK